MRLRILNEEDIDSLYGLPRFTQEARVEYFALSDSEKTALEQFHSLKSKLFFVLQLGYFKASRMFFVFGLRDVEEDTAYLMETRFPNFENRDAIIAKGTRLKQQQLILALCNYRNFDGEAQKKLQAKAQQVATVCGKPLYVFRELMHSLSEQRIVAPGYSTMQDIVGGALTYEQRRLAGIAQVHVYPSARKDLERLLEDRQGLHEITLLKRDPRDFSNSEIKREVQRKEEARELYRLSQELLPHLEISTENIGHYASLVEYYSVHRLRQLSESVVHVYLLCFIQQRFRKLHDNLIQSMVHHVRRHGDDAKAAAKERVYNLRIATNDDMPKSGQVLRLFTDESIAGSTPFEAVRQRAYAMLTPTGLLRLPNPWCPTRNSMRQLCSGTSSTRLRKEKDPSASHSPRSRFRRIGSRRSAHRGHPVPQAGVQKGKALGTYKENVLPVRWIPEKMKRYIYGRDKDNRKQLLPDRYEFLLYKHLRQRYGSR